MKLASILTIILCYSSGYGQTALYPIEVNGKAGYINYDGKVIVPPTYQKAKTFINGYGFAYSKTGRVVVFDTTGAIVSEFSIDFSEGEPMDYSPHFSEGLFMASDSATHLYGYRDSKGDWIIKPKFYEITDFSDSIAAVWEDPDIHADEGSDCGTELAHPKWGFINHSGEYVIKPKYHMCFPSGKGYWLACNDTTSSKGEFIHRLEAIGKNGMIVNSDHLDSGERCNSLFLYKNHLRALHVKGSQVYLTQLNSGLTTGFFTFRIGYRGDGLQGYMDCNGKVVIDPIYSYADSFSNGLAVVARPVGKYGYIDTNGKTVIDYQYDYALPFSEGLAAVEVNGKWGYIEKNGRLIIEPRYKPVSNHNIQFSTLTFKNGLALVEYEGKAMYINKKGEIVWQAP